MTDDRFFCRPILLADELGQLSRSSGIPLMMMLMIERQKAVTDGV